MRTASSFLKKSILCLFLAGVQLSAHAQVHDITLFGAIGDGKTDNTVSIQRAIDSCAVRGGKVYFPAGKFLSATLYLKSNVTLYLSGGAVLLGSPDTKQYPYQEPGIHFYGEGWAKQALLFCKQQENVSIEGSGTIDGQGAQFVVNTIKKPDRYRDRPYLLWFVGSKNISVRGVHLRNSAFWMQHYLGCDGVTIDGINIWNHSNKNNDMMDIDGCKNVTISNVNGDSDDDGITVKSTSPLISENITITNCVISSHCNGLKFGTESTGGFRNVVVSNCVIKPSAQHTTIYGKPSGMGGLALEVADGGIMENVSINNIVIEGPMVPIFMRLNNRARKYMDGAIDPPLGKIKNVHLSNITATGADETGCSLTGIAKAPLEDVTLTNISIETKGTDSLFSLDQKVEEMETEYPEGTMFGKLPSYGLYIRYVNGIKLSGIHIYSRNGDTRPGIVIDSVNHFSLADMDIQAGKQTRSLIYIRRSNDGVVSGNAPFAPAKSFLLKDKYSTKINTTNLPK